MMGYYPDVAKKPKRWYHFAIMTPNSVLHPDGTFTQTGCAAGRSVKEAKSFLDDSWDTVKRMPAKDCPVCKGNND